MAKTEDASAELDGLSLADMGAPVTLGALWTREAMFIEDRGFKTPSGFHFPAFAQTSMELDSSWLNNILYIFPQTDLSAIGQPKSGVGRAEMKDGQNVDLMGEVIWAGPQDNYASFPSMWRDDNGVWLMVFEQSFVTRKHEDTEIGLATSSDGVSWHRHEGAFFKRQEGNPHMKCGIGTPSLYKVNGKWYLYFHGFDCHDVHVFLATATNLGGPWTYENGGRPVIPTGSDVRQGAGDSPADSGTIGRRSVLAQEGLYYIVYEISEDLNYCMDRNTNQPCPNKNFGGVNWATAVARSQDLVNWDKNPSGVRGMVIPPTYKIFGNDGPTFGPGPGGRVYIYYRVADNSTRRVALVSYDGAINAVFRHFVGRDPTDGDRAHYKEALRNGSVSFDSFVEEIKGSAEAKARPTVADPTTWFGEQMEAKPVPTPAPGASVDGSQRQWNQVFRQLWFPQMGSHVFTANLGECVNGCNMMGDWFKAMAPAPETHDSCGSGNVKTLYRAAKNLGNRWVFDIDAWESGYTQLVSQGWQAQGPVANILCSAEAGYVPLYKFINPTTADRFYSLTPELPAGYQNIGVIGYVLPANGQPPAAPANNPGGVSSGGPSPTPTPTPASPADIARAGAVPIFGGHDSHGWNLYSASASELAGRQNVGVVFKAPLDCGATGGTPIIRASREHVNLGHVFDFDVEASQAALYNSGWRRDGFVFCIVPEYPGTVGLYKCLDSRYANRYYSTSASCPAGMEGPIKIGNVYPQ